jgi:hypothetical protein
MSSPALSESVRILLHQHVHSHDELEILLALHGEPSSAWTARAVTAKLGISLARVEAILAQLCGRHLIVMRELAPTSWFRYSPANHELDTAVGALAEVYRDAPHAVLKLMSTQAIERVREAAAKPFRSSVADDE